MKRTFTALLAAITLLLVAGCSKLTETNLQKIHNGMSPDEVKAILGDPTDSETKNLLGISSTVYTYHTDTSNVAITFINDKVFSTEGDFK